MLPLRGTSFMDQKNDDDNDDDDDDDNDDDKLYLENDWSTKSV